MSHFLIYSSTWIFWSFLVSSDRIDYINQLMTLSVIQLSGIQYTTLKMLTLKNADFLLLPQFINDIFWRKKHPFVSHSFISFDLCKCKFEANPKKPFCTKSDGKLVIAWLTTYLIGNLCIYENNWSSRLMKKNTDTWVIFLLFLKVAIAVFLTHSVIVLLVINFCFL